MIVGVDCDGVIANPNPSWVRFFNRADHEHVGIEEVEHPQTWAGVNNVCRSCFQAVLQDPETTLDCDIYPGAAEALHRMSCVAELVFITHRREEVKKATLQWLEGHGIKQYFSGFVFCSNNKALRAKEAGAAFHIDDSPGVAQEFHDARHRNITMESSSPQLLLIDKEYNQGSPAFAKFKSLDAASRFIVRYSEMTSRIVKVDWSLFEPA